MTGYAAFMPTAKSLLSAKWMQNPAFNAAALLMAAAFAARLGLDIPALIRAAQCAADPAKVEAHPVSAPVETAPVPGGSILEHSVPATLTPGEWPAPVEPVAE